MKITTTFAETRSQFGRPRVLVPTMGALHAGHVSLFETAVVHGGAVVASVFVNPLQFNDGADLSRYPRDLDADAEICERAGVDVLFAPELDEMFSEDPVTRLDLGPVAAEMEGRFRPGHFEGVATVVAKLFAGIQPDAAVFGKKDAQQLAVVRTLVRDLSFPVEVIAGSTIREADGMALSSRNTFLDVAARRDARRISTGLFRAAALIEGGERSATVLTAAIRTEIPDVEYAELASQDRASLMTELDRPAFLAVAAKIGGVRLIDNIAIDSIDPLVIDVGTALGGSNP